DVISWARYDARSEFPVTAAIGAGISQSGRFLRHFLYQGFNTDEAGRKVFDGLLVHTAGAGRGSFNHRFAQPSRDAHRYSSFFYPTDLFPFTSRPQRDAETGREDGLAARPLDPTHWPRVFYTNTGYEYWARAASLIHTPVNARRDAGPVRPEGVITVAPPRAGAPCPALVPQVDAFGNELGGVRGVELLVPLATYTPWNLRTGYPASTDELVDFLGTWVPLPRTAADAA